MADNGDGNAWDDLIGDLRELWDSGRDDDLVTDTLHELWVQDPDAFKDAIYEMTDNPAERHELWTAAMYE